jgi:hypothetical protein
LRAKYAAERLGFGIDHRQEEVRVAVHVVVARTE